MFMAVKKLKQSKNVLATIDEWRRPWNNDHPRDRVRLDNQPEDKIENSYKKWVE